MTRKAINDLRPGTNYVIQARAGNEDGFGEWSRKFQFTTIVYDTTPKTPTNVTWTVDDDGFHAEWDAVTKNVSEEDIDILRYHVRVEDDLNVTKQWPVEPSGESRVAFSISFAEVQAKFGRKVLSLDMAVRAVDKHRNQSAWSETLFATLEAPDPPTNGRVESAIDSMTVLWDAPLNMEYVTRYHVYMSLDPEFVPSPNNRVYSGTALSFTYGTSTYMTHYFKIRSYSEVSGLESADCLAEGEPLSPFGVDLEPPAIPSALSVSSTFDGGTAIANLTWTFDELAEGNEDIQAFAIRWQKVGQTNFYIDFADKESRALSLPLPQAFADYEFQIASVDATANYSEFSTPPVGLDNSIPGPPPQTVGVTAQTGLDNIQLAWTPSTHGDVTYGGFYEVQIATDSGFTANLLNYQTGNTSLSVSGLDPDTTYYYRVRAVDVTEQEGSYSTTGNATTSGFEIPEQTDGDPPASSPAATAHPAIGAIHVSWPVVANADLVKYEVHISTNAAFVPTLGGATKVAETPGTVVTLTRDAAGAALAYGTSYYVRIIAKDADTTSGNAPAAGTVSAAVSPKKSDSADITTIIADQIATGSLSSSIITISTGGAIQSANYVAGTTGFKISDTVVDIRSGTVGFGTLAAGTLSTTGLIIGAGGRITIDSTGAIQSNNWASLTTGWKISSNGIEMNDANSKIKAVAIVGDTVTGRDLTVTSGGSIHSSNWNGSSTGWSLGNTGLTIYNGTIYGASVQTNQLYSIASGLTSTGRTFEINSGGFAEFSGAKILGNTILGSSSSTTHYLQSYNYSPGTSGWKIDATGNADFNSGTITGALFKTKNTGERVEISDSLIGDIRFYNSSNQIQAYIDSYPGGMGIEAGSGEFYLTSTSVFMGCAGQIELWGTSGTFITGQAGLQVEYGLEVGAYGISSNGQVDLNGNNLIGIGQIGNGGSFALNGTLNMASGNISGGLTVAGGVDSTTNGETFNANNPPSLTGIPNARWAGTTTGGNLTYTSHANSSIRYKKDLRILDLDVSAADVLSVPVYSYEWREEAPGYESGLDRQVGFIAEELDDAGFGRWVGYDAEGRPDEVDYAKWTTLLHLVAQKHDAEIKELRDEIKNLRRKNADSTDPND